jgi:F-type H+-transporting ATPase subunit delta
VKNSKVAKRYARALLGLSNDNSQLETWGAELEKLARIVEVPEIAAGFASPEVSLAVKIEALAKVAEKINLSFPVRSFMVVIAQHGRIDDLPAIAPAYRNMLDGILRRTRASLTFALQPDDRELERVISRLESIAQKKVIPTVRIDGALLGGVIVELEGKTYDGSLATQLAEAQQQLAG